MMSKKKIHSFIRECVVIFGCILMYAVGGGGGDGGGDVMGRKKHEKVYEIVSYVPTKRERGGERESEGERERGGKREGEGERERGGEGEERERQSFVTKPL